MVYKARQPRLDRFVALKILPLDMRRDAAFAERFEREAKALARLNHPGIVAVYDFGQTKDYYYFVMEYVDGMNLRQLIQGQKIEPRQALELVMQICTALQFAHDEQIVHRDIKPENILITKKGQVKIADFGLAKLLGGQPDISLTASQMAMGTMNYMAPEQRENTKDVDHRADIYSLGVVFYEMLTGEVPMGRFDPPSKKVQVDVRLDEVVLHALEREPARRYQQVSEVKTGVESISSSMTREKNAPAQTETFKPTLPPGFIAFVSKRFAIAAGAWLAIAFCLRWLLGDFDMTATFKDNIWHWSLGNWQATFPPSQTVPIGYTIVGACAIGFSLHAAWILLPAVFGLTALAWLEAWLGRGLKLRQLPPLLRRRYWLRIGILVAGHMVAAMGTLGLCIVLAPRPSFSIREMQNREEETSEWWYFPSSRAYAKLGLNATFATAEPADLNNAATPPDCTVSLIVYRTNAEPVTMKVILPGLRASYRLPATNTWDYTFILDRDSFAEWFHKAAELDTSSPKIKEETGQIYSLLKEYELQPPQTVKEFINLVKADLRDFSFAGMQGGSFSFGGGGGLNLAILVSLITVETLVFIILTMWMVRTVYRAAWAEIEAGRWTPAQKARVAGTAGDVPPGASGPLPQAQITGADFLAVALFILTLFVEYIAGTFVPLVGLLLMLATIYIGVRWLAKRLKNTRGFEFGPKVWSVTHAGHRIRVDNSWNRGMKLFVDDVCQASSSRIFALDKTRPILRCELAAGTSPYVIEVYCYARAETLVKIVVNGQWVGGDNF